MESNVQSQDILFYHQCVFSTSICESFLQLTDFYNWNRVKLRYCDGASFGGDAVFDNGVRNDISLMLFAITPPS